MPMRTDHFDGEETERVLGVVLCPTSYGKSIYVRVPTLDTDRRTDGGAKDIGGAPDYAEDIVERDFYDIEYAFKKENGKYVHTDEGDLVTFADKANAEAMRKATDDSVDIVEVTN